MTPLENYVRLFGEKALFVVPIDAHAVVESFLMTTSGHDDRAAQCFTRERVFWLLDERSEWLSR